VSEPARQRPGPKPRFSQDDVVDAALSITEADGFAALSLRAVARELGITSMAMYTYVTSRDDLCLLVVDRLIADKVAAFEWPDSWSDALRRFATSLSSLIDEHPAIIDAFAEGQMRTAVAMSMADHMLGLLLDAGLPPRGAGVAYASMHALVLGHGILQRAATTRDAVEPDATRPTPALAAYAEHEGRLVDITLGDMLDVLIAGIEASQPDRRKRGRR
jgi:AcrR family transcriptional regulator